MVLFHRGSVALALACSVAFAWVLVPLSAGATVAASIDASRTSGAAPLGVVFHGQRSTTHSSLSAEERWQQLDYEWDFSDCFPFETWSTTGASKAKSYGPITARVFTDIGTCDVVLTVSEDGSTSDTDTIAITVNDPDTTWSGSDTLCVDADATPTPGSDGCPSGADAEENDDFDDAVNSNIGSYGRILFRNDETYSCASTASLSAGSDGLIGTYGDGARALLDCSFSNATPVVTAYGGGHDDYRFTGFRLQGGGGDASIVHAEADGSHVVGLLVHDIFIESGFDTVGGTFPNDIVGTDPEDLHDGTIYSKIDADGVGTGTGGSIFYGAVQNGAWIENTITDCNSEHCLRLAFARDAVIEANDLGPQDNDKKHVITVRSPDTTTTDGNDCFAVGFGSHTERVVIIGNSIDGYPGETVGFGITKCGPESGSATIGVDQVIFDSNYFKVATEAIGSDFVSVVRGSGTYHTVRNNLFSMDDSEAHGDSEKLGHRVIEMGGSTNRVYNNTAWDSSSTTTGPVRMLQGTGLDLCVNNVYVNESGSFSSPYSCTTEDENLTTTTNPFEFDDSTAGPLAFVPADGSALDDAGSSSTPASRLRDALAADIDGTVDIGAVEEQPDSDGDGVPDNLDNCVDVQNGPSDSPADQSCDTDQDGFGNVCDADFNNDGGVGGPDLGVYSAAFGSSGSPGFSVADTNCDGTVGGPDSALISIQFGGPPGPSGMYCAGSDGCVTP